MQAVAADPSGRWIASGGADRSVKIWNVETHDARRTYRNNSDFISNLAFSPDGATLAVGSLDGTSATRIIEVPGLLSFLATGDFQGEVMGMLLTKENQP